MALKIRYLDGPQANREVTIDDEKTEIHFGRGIDADVAFPDDLTLVSREHFGLRKEYGGYKFVINPEKPVFMDGRPLYDDQALPKDATIQLGSLSGPRLKLERIDGRGSNQMKTEVLKPQREMAHDVRATAVKGNRTLGFVLGVAALVFVLGGLGWLIATSLREDVTAVQQQVTAIQTDMPALRADLASAQKANIDAPGIIAKNKESVYLVIQQDARGNDTSGATASVVMLPDGRKALATNAHVAGMYLELSVDPKLAGGRVIVRQSKAPDYTTLQVTSVLVHPGYEILNTWMNSFGARVEAGAVLPLEFSAPGYDVALLFVDEPEKLGPPIKLASREDIAALRAGDPLVYIGYPAENLSGADPTAPEPTSQTGHVTSVTTFFLSPGKHENEYLVQHSAPATGGASGSAMFNAKGEAVAFLNAGNATWIADVKGIPRRVGNAALVNYAQRADLMLDLIEGTADVAVPEIKKQIAEADARLSVSEDKRLVDIQADLAQIAGGAENVKKLTEFEGTMSTPIPEIGSPKNLLQSFEVAETALYVFLLQSEDKRLVKGALIFNGKFAAGPGAASIALVGSVLTKGQKITFVGIDMSAVISPDEAGSDGKVKVTVYQLPPPKDGS